MKRGDDAVNGGGTFRFSCNNASACRLFAPGRPIRYEVIYRIEMSLKYKIKMGRGGFEPP